MKSYLMSAMLMAALIAVLPRVAWCGYVPDDVPRDHWASEALEYLDDIEAISGCDFFKGERSMTLLETTYALRYLVYRQDDGTYYSQRHDLAKDSAVAEAILDGTTRHELVPADDSCYAQLDLLQKAGLLQEYPTGFFLGCGELRPWQIALALWEATRESADRKLPLPAADALESLSIAYNQEVYAILVLRQLLDP